PLVATTAIIQIPIACQRSLLVSQSTGLGISSLRRRFARRADPPYFHVYVQDLDATIVFPDFCCHVRGMRTQARAKRNQAITWVVTKLSQKKVRPQPPAALNTKPGLE